MGPAPHRGHRSEPPKMYDPSKDETKSPIPNVCFFFFFSNQLRLDDEPKKRKIKKKKKTIKEEGDKKLQVHSAITHDIMLPQEGL